MRHVNGMWIAGKHIGLWGPIVDVYEDRLIVAVDGSKVYGAPSDFRADTGESGDALMAKVLPAPDKARLFHGAVRESLASSHAVATSGNCETRSWDSLGLYVISDEEGGVGLIDFAADSAVGALLSHDGWREFDVDEVIRNAPTPVRARLAAICAAPLLRSSTVIGISAVFWSGDAVLESVEPWHSVHVHGGALITHELMDDREWTVEASHYYDLDEMVASTICRVARRRTLLEPLALTSSELELLVPRDARRRSEGLERLLSGGAVVGP